MYVAPPSMPRIYQQYLVAMGVQEYAIELIGTNVPIIGENATEKINFRITDHELGEADYQANIGQTWREWVKLDYNTAGYRIITTQYGDLITNGYEQTIFDVELIKSVFADDYILMDGKYGVD
jgi:hypothetical protein